MKKEIKQLLYISFFTWLTYSILFVGFSTYDEITNEGGYDFWSGIQLYLSLFLISLLFECPIMTGFLFSFSKITNKYVENFKIKQIALFIGTSFIQLISFPIAFNLLFSIKHQKLSAFYEAITTHITHLFEHLNRYYPVILIYLFVSILFTYMISKPRKYNDN